MRYQPSRVLRLLLWPGVILFVLPGLVRTYLLMPFPGSQELQVFTLCYYLDTLVPPLRLLGAALMLLPIAASIRHGSWKRRAGMAALLIVCGVSWYATTFVMSAERMFREPATVTFARGVENTVAPETIVLGVVANSVAKAYPIRFLAFHHKVHDSLGPQPILVTYCSMCRTGRVFLPVIDGRVQHFRLVGAREYNAIIEDDETKSWWYQATGEAMIGPRAGMRLDEIRSEEMTLRAWTERHPSTLVYQPDPASEEGYHMFGFARWDSVRPSTGYFDSTQYWWKPSSWVIGVPAGSHAKAYPWGAVMQTRVLNDSFSGVRLVLIAEPDSISFHVFNREVQGEVLSFLPFDNATMRDSLTQSTWDWSGTCIAGPFVGQHLTPLRGYREYWHSWKTFHASTERLGE